MPPGRPDPWSRATEIAAAGLAVVADGLPAAGGAGGRRLPVIGHVALPAARRLNRRPPMRAELTWRPPPLAWSLLQLFRTR